MRKIPTLFKRDPENMSRVLPEVTPGCEWVIEGEGVPTRKYDGTCVMFDGHEWWARREVKSGKPAPPNYQALSLDENTGKIMGYEPIEQSSYAKWFTEALDGRHELNTDVGTYELCGPKVNGNPERFTSHKLVKHADAVVLADAPRSFDELRTYLADFPHEGIVWHHPDGRMAKLKRRDFLATSPKEDG